MKFQLTIFLLIACLMALFVTSAYAVDDMNVHNEEIGLIDHDQSTDYTKHLEDDSEDSVEDVSDYESDNIDTVEKASPDYNDVIHTDEGVDVKYVSPSAPTESSIESIPSTDELNVDKHDTSASTPVLQMKVLISGLIDEINHRRHQQAPEPATPELTPGGRTHRKRAWGGRGMERRHSRGYAQDGGEEEAAE